MLIAKSTRDLYYGKKENRSPSLQFWFPSGIKKALKIAADRDSRSMASIVEKLIKDHLKKEGISWEDNGGV